jgi:hypothetical protein
MSEDMKWWEENRGFYEKYLSKCNDRNGFFVVGLILAAALKTTVFASKWRWHHRQQLNNLKSYIRYKYDPKNPESLCDEIMKIGGLSKEIVSEVVKLTAPKLEQVRRFFGDQAEKKEQLVKEKDHPYAEQQRAIEAFLAKRVTTEPLTNNKLLSISTTDLARLVLFMHCNSGDYRFLTDNDFCKSHYPHTLASVIKGINGFGFEDDLKFTTHAWKPETLESKHPLKWLVGFYNKYVLNLNVAAAAATAKQEKPVAAAPLAVVHEKLYTATTMAGMNFRYQELLKQYMPRTLENLVATAEVILAAGYGPGIYEGYKNRRNEVVAAIQQASFPESQSDCRL